MPFNSRRDCWRLAWFLFGLMWLEDTFWASIALFSVKTRNPPPMEFVSRYKDLGWYIPPTEQNIGGSSIWLRVKSIDDFLRNEFSIYISFMRYEWRTNCLMKYHTQPRYCIQSYLCHVYFFAFLRNIKSYKQVRSV